MFYIIIITPIGIPDCANGISIGKWGPTIRFLSVELRLLDAY